MTSKVIFTVLFMLGLQTPPKFEVASIKPNPMKEGNKSFSMVSNPGGIVYRQVSLGDCIQAAYGVKGVQISGPTWINSDRYDILARTSGKATDDEMKKMLQDLLAERFKPAFHRDTRELQVYSLLTGMGEPKLRLSHGEGKRTVKPAPGGLAMEGTSMAELIAFLSGLRIFDGPIVDATGLMGRYDFTLILVDTDDADPAAIKRSIERAGPDVFAGAVAQLGLRLEARKMPTQVLVIDHVEKPTEN